ncbi:MAG: hypothetical protein OHK93_003739 [Ramalina farinacea]|uniref:Uncharacterized protein n=1 Tax=Ramalina farinacea TaxID=258253 RepID=A0AA43U060_9LECA|nr:hypothetical protein [Ramalina farinacea]
MAQATPSQNIAVTPETHHTSPHQRPPTALGILGRFSPEVRNQLYRNIFHGQKAAFALQWRQQQSSNRPKHSFGIMTASKTIRAEAEPYFYQYCHFNLDVRFSQDRSQFTLTKVAQRLQQELSRMQNIVLEATPFDSHGTPDGNPTDQVAFIPIEPHAPDERGLLFPNIFDDLCSNGHELLLGLVFDLKSVWAFGNGITVQALQAMFIPFRRYEIVRFCLEIRNSQDNRPRMVVSPVQFASISQMFQGKIEEILGPGTRAFTVERTEARWYYEWTDFHPKSHFEAMAKGEGLE